MPGDATSRATQGGLLHTDILDHVDDFLRAGADRTDGVGVPEFPSGAVGND